MTRGLDLLVRPARVEASLWRRLGSDGGCREALFNRYVGLARGIARRHFHRRAVKTVDRGDFEQFAFEGLLHAIDRFDPLQGVPFDAYARRRIAGSVSDGVSRMTEVNTQISHRHRATRERVRSLRTSESEQDPVSALADLAACLALGLILEGTSLLDREGSCDTRPLAYETLEWREMQAGLVREVARLPENEAIVLRQHYENGLSFTQIAELLKLSRGRVSQLHRSALDRLRRKMGAFK